MEFEKCSSQASYYTLNTYTQAHPETTNDKYHLIIRILQDEPRAYRYKWMSYIYITPINGQKQTVVTGVVSLALYKWSIPTCSLVPGVLLLPDFSGEALVPWHRWIREADPNGMAGFNSSHDELMFMGISGTPPQSY